MKEVEGKKETLVASEMEETLVDDRRNNMHCFCSRRHAYVLRRGAGVSAVPCKRGNERRLYSPSKMEAGGKAHCVISTR